MSMRVVNRQDFPNYSSYTLNTQALKDGSIYSSGFYVIPNHWLAKEVLDFHNGRMAFITTGDDTLTIQYDALPGQSWRATRLPNGGYLKAIAGGIGPQQMCDSNVFDQVKQIEFQAFNQFNSPEFHPWNGKIMRLSQNHGLYEFLHLSNFPDWDLTYSSRHFLTGYDRDSLGCGYTTMSFREVMDLKPGMELHYYNSSYNWCTETRTYSQQAWLINQVTWIDSTELRIEYELFNKNYPTVTDSVLNYAGTMGKVFKLTDFDYRVVEKSAGEYDLIYFQGLDAMRLSRYQMSAIPNHRKKGEILVPKDFSDSLYYYGDAFTGHRSKVFHEGLGMTGEHFYDYCYSESWGLVYFKTGNEVWGNPHTIVGRKERRESSLPMTLFPNPGNGSPYLSFYLDQPVPKEVRIYSMEGKILWKRKWGQMPPGEQRLHIESGLPPGLYILELRAGEKRSREKILVQ